MISALLFLSCQDDDDFSSSEDPINGENSMDDQLFQDTYFGNRVTKDFIGFVQLRRDESKVSDAQVRIGNKTVTTDRNGIYIIKDAEVFENFALAEVTEQGYNNRFRSIIPKESGYNTLRIPLNNYSFFNLADLVQNDSIRINHNFSKLRMKANFTSENGSAFNGEGIFIFNYVSPLGISPYFASNGIRLGQSQQNRRKYVRSYGFVELDFLSTPNYDPINIDLDANNPAFVEIDIREEDLSDAPDEISIWHFDENVGYWKEQGTATKINNTYVAAIPKKGKWNFAVANGYAEACINLQPQNIDSKKPYRLYITSSDSFFRVFYDGVVHANDGSVCIPLPKNESINAYVYAADLSCQEQGLHIEPIGTLSDNTNFTISFTDEAVNKVRVTGTITDCSGQPLRNGYVLVPPIENSYFSKVNAFGISNGIIDFTIDDCFLDNLNVQIYDFENSQDKTVFNASLTGENTIDLGNLNICNNENSIYNGDVRLRNQTEVNEFGMFNYKIIKGSLQIIDEANDISDLTPLSSLEEVRHRLLISGNQIQSLDGLHNLKNADESIRIFQTGLTSLEGLEQITQTNTLMIENNAFLASLNGLQNITNVDEFLKINNNNALTNLEGLDSLAYLGGLMYIINNQNLVSLDGLDKLLNVRVRQGIPFDFINIGIGGQYIDVPSFESAPNPNLTDFCALENLFVNGNGDDIILEVGNNAFNPSQEDIKNGDCNNL